MKMRIGCIDNIDNRMLKKNLKVLLTQIKNLKPEVSYALYEEGYNNYLCEVLDIIERMMG